MLLYRIAEKLSAGIESGTAQLVFRSAFLGSLYPVPIAHRRRRLLQKIPYELYRVAGIAHVLASPYAAAMECFFTCPPIEQELVIQR